MVASPGAGRVIVHVDMDAFFAAVEVRERPELAGRPVIVGAPRDSRRGVVSTCSYEARRFGVHSAMPIRKAVELCPQGVFLEARHGLYREVSQRILTILESFSPEIEPVSIDEAYLDMTRDTARFESLRAMGEAIKSRIRTEQRLTASVGIAPNKFLAKLATELSKPDGLMVMEPDGVDRVLLPLPVHHLPGVGPRTAQRLRGIGVHRVEDVRALSRDYLVRRLGQFGETLFELARGIDTRPVQPPQEARSISAELTFEHDVRAMIRLREELAALAAEVGRRLRAEGLWARTVTLKARYPDFVTVTRRTTLSEPAADDGVLFQTAWSMLVRLSPGAHGLRLLGIGASGLTRFTQGQLWESNGGGALGAPGGPDRARLAALDRALDRINARYARMVVARGRVLKSAEETGRSVPRDTAGG